MVCAKTLGQGRVWHITKQGVAQRGYWVLNERESGPRWGWGGEQESDDANAEFCSPSLGPV